MHIFSTHALNASHPLPAARGRLPGGRGHGGRGVRGGAGVCGLERERERGTRCVARPALRKPIAHCFSPSNIQPPPPFLTLPPPAHALGVHPGPSLPLPQRATAAASRCCVGALTQGVHGAGRAHAHLHFQFCSIFPSSPPLTLVIAPSLSLLSGDARRRPALRAGCPGRRPTHLECRGGCRLRAGDLGAQPAGVVKREKVVGF